MMNKNISKCQKNVNERHEDGGRGQGKMHLEEDNKVKVREASKT